ncbi:protein of unknown function [Pseudomonas sp. ok272]|uniref:DUF4160 domain-containing protein n=1 Tax=unclassified Pseudomonas TaxID=196821 RepID=UPI0008BC8EF4|nr:MULTISPECIES: DUF4160 domain-containing protein [unclassified Pseudomonas]SEM39765.1 protein of unknown function [Pseudomonas sp. ok272]SFN31519.1 protein of unknown function [Pseudomonas sp. ok602]
MSTKHRFRDKYRIQLRERDHLPPPVHLVGGGLDVMISLQTIEVMVGYAPALIVQEAQEWIRAHREELLEEWKRWHP